MLGWGGVRAESVRFGQAKRAAADGLRRRESRSLTATLARARLGGDNTGAAVGAPATHGGGPGLPTQYSGRGFVGGNVDSPRRLAQGWTGAASDRRPGRAGGRAEYVTARRTRAKL